MQIWKHNSVLLYPGYSNICRWELSGELSAELSDIWKGSQFWCLLHPNLNQIANLQMNNYDSSFQNGIKTHWEQKSVKSVNVCQFGSTTRKMLFLRLQRKYNFGCKHRRCATVNFISKNKMEAAIAEFYWRCIFKAQRLVRTV